MHEYGCRWRSATVGVVAGMALLVAGVLAGSAQAAITAAPPNDPGANALAQSIVFDPTTLRPGSTFGGEVPPPVAPPDGPNAVADAGTPLAGFPVHGPTYAILSTGNAQFADDPNVSGSTSHALGGDNGPLRGDTDFDVTSLKVRVNVPGNANCLSLNYRFLSDEFPEFVNTSFNDAFVAEVDNSSWFTAATEIGHPNDFATFANGRPVSINGVGETAVSERESAGTTYDAATGLVNTKTPITPGDHTIILSIFDQGDQVWDAAVFLDRLAFINEPPATCRPPNVPGVSATNPPAGPAPQPLPGAPSNEFTVGSSITLKPNGTAVIVVTVPGPGSVEATDGGGGYTASDRAEAARKKRKKPKKAKALVKKTTVQATQAGPVSLTIRPTSAAVKLLNKKGKLTVRVKVTYTPTGGAPNSKTIPVTLKKKKQGKRKRK